MTESEPGKSADNPWPVRAVAIRVASRSTELGTVWVEGQIAQLKVRPDGPRTSCCATRPPTCRCR